MRHIININDNWKFIQENITEASARNFDTSNWESVQIPHSWNAMDGITGDNDYFRGACWYQKEFSVANHHAGKKIFIEFNAVNSIANVYLNGKHLGEHRGGYSVFRYDITDIVEFGAVNTLAVQADNSNVPDVYPLWADFTFYGGIYRDVNIIVTDDVHFDLMDHGSTGIYIAQESVTDEVAHISVTTRVANESDAEQAVRIWADVLDREGNVVRYGAKDIIVPASTTEVTKLPITITDPILWDGVKNPYLYDVRVTIMYQNDVIDELTFSLGLRYFHFDAKEGLFLNGKHIKLNGVSRHQDKKAKGWALSKEDHDLDMALIKEVGANSIRLAHYQHDEYFYDLCDKEGMVIWAEIPFISIASKTDFTGENAKSQMVELIRQNFNHSSIIMWGVQNEIQIGGDRPEVRQIVRELNALTKAEDPTRLTTQAQVMMVPNDDEYHTYTDIVAYNKYYGWYMGEAEDFAEWADDFHATNPDKCLGISEYGAEGILTYHTDTPVVKDYTEEYHALYHEKVMKIFNERNFIWGTYVWNFFDFGSDFRNEGGVKGRNNKGLVTFDRKVKKDAFYLYKAMWSDETFVHITSKRFLDRATETINVKVYSNCDEVTLYLNGKEVGTQTGTHSFTFENLTLVEGQNEVKAVATKDGKVVTDYALWNKVAEPNPVYECPEEKGGIVTNWFNDDKNKYEDVVITELNISDDVYSTKCSVKQLLANEETKKVLEEHLSGLLESDMIGMMEGMSIDQLVDFDSEAFSDKLIFVLNRELSKIKK